MSSGTEAPLRVLHVIRGLANSSGTTHIVIPLAESQARQGARVRVLHVDKPLEPSLDPDPRLVASRRFPLTLPLDNPGLSLGFASAIHREVASADVVHVHAVWNFPTWWTMRAAARARVPYVVAPQGSFDPWALGLNARAKRAYARLTELPLIDRAACLQALTAKEARQFAEAGLSAPVEIVPNGIPDTLFDRPSPPSLAAQLGLPEGTQTLLFLSRIHPKKGLPLLVEAFARLLASPAGARVALVVAGSDKGSGHLAEVGALAEALGVADRCRFVGELSGARKLDALMGADAFVLPSHSEGLPVAALEALGAGLPAVLSTECNLAEVAAADAGWVVSPEAGSLAGALIELFDDPQSARARGRRARDLVRSRFGWDGIAGRTLDLYRRLVDAAQASREGAR